MLYMSPHTPPPAFQCWFDRVVCGLWTAAMCVRRWGWCTDVWWMSDFRVQIHSVTSVRLLPGICQSVSHAWVTWSLLFVCQWLPTVWNMCWQKPFTAGKSAHLTCYLHIKTIYYGWLPRMFVAEHWFLCFTFPTFLRQCFGFSNMY